MPLEQPGTFSPHGNPEEKQPGGFSLLRSCVLSSKIQTFHCTSLRSLPEYGKNPVGLPSPASKKRGSRCGAEGVALTLKETVVSPLFGPGFGSGFFGHAEENPESVAGPQEPR